MKSEIVRSLIDIVGKDWVVTELSQMQSYLYDETEMKIRPVASEDCVVVKPGTTEEVSEVVKIANEYVIPIVPRGGGTGACGAAIPTQSSIIISMERFKKIIELDQRNLMITVEAGVTLAELNEEIAKHEKLFFPIHPGDEGAHVGGMVIENAGGVRAIKHGIMRNHIKGLKVVLPTGEIVNMGGKLNKNNMGYDLLHMMIGSEGTLGIVTEATLKLYPKNDFSGTLVVSFNNKEDATSVVSVIQQAGIIPLAIEYMDREIALETASHLGLTWPAQNDGKVDLIFILDEPTEDLLYTNCERIVELCEANGAVDSLIAETTKEQRNILEIRSNIYTAFIELIADSLDTAVPSASVPNLLDDFYEIAKKYNTVTPAVGHLADGNFHNFIMLVDGEVPDYIDDMRSEMYDAALKYGGTITAEHGTGKTRKKYMHHQYSDREIQIMKNVKKAFDPKGIFNPGTIID